MTYLSTNLLLLLSLALVWLADATDELDAPIELTDANFDQTVFPPNVGFEQQEPYLIFFYAPWCGHCKKLKPVFRNASDALAVSQFAKKHAHFALVDATSQKALAKRFSVKSFPSLYYTVNGRGHHYEGGRTLQDLIAIAVYVHHGVALGKFTDDVSSPERFEGVDTEAPGRSAFVVFVPKEAPRQQERRSIAPVDPTFYESIASDEVKELEAKEREDAAPFLFHIAMEAAISYGKSRYAVIYEANIPTAVRGDHKQFSRVMEVAHKCQRNPETRKGPNGESLILYSDAHRKPLCYRGTWFQADSKSIGTSSPQMPRGVAQLRVHRDLLEFVDRNSILAVEEISSETYTTMSRRPGLLMVLATNGPLPKEDTTMLPLLREIVQERNAAQLAAEESLKSNIESVDDEGASTRPKTEFVFAHLDGTLFYDWCKEHGISVPSDLPALLAVAPMKELAYHSHHVEGFVESSKQLPWVIGGTHHQNIRRFMRMLDRGEIPAYRVSTIGKVAEYVLMIPYADRVHEMLGGDDTTFLTILFVVFFTLFVILLACRPEHPDRMSVSDPRSRQASQGGEPPVRRRKEE